MRPRFRKYTAKAALAALALSAPIASAQVYPLSENSWNNPEFVKRFTGSYGFNTEIEPKLQAAEGDLMKDLAQLMADGKSQDAIKLLQTNITPESSAALDYTLGSLLLQQGQIEPAVQRYKAAIKKFPGYMRAYKNLGLAYLSDQKFEEALPYLQKAVELGDRDSNTFGLLGFAYLNTGKFEAALDAYRIAVVVDPKNKDWEIGKASALMQAGHYDQAIPVFKELIERDPKREAYYTSIANAYLSTGNQDQAALYLEMLRRQGKAEADVLMLLGDIYVNKGLSDLAVTVYEQALEGNVRGKAERLIRFATALTQRGAYDEAKAFIDKLQNSDALKLASDDKQALLNLSAEIALATEQKEEAVTILEDLLREDPLNGRALLLLGGYNLDNGEFEKAAYYFERAEKIPAVQVDAYIQDARLKVAQKDYGQAVRLLETAQSIEPRSNVADYLEAVRQAFESTR